MVTTRTVTTRVRQGELRGSEHHSVLRFAGIPYAAPATGALRFRRPEPPEPWSGVRDASAFGPIAPQQNLMATMLGIEPEPQDEACHFLNVFTPQIDDARRPVLVWFNGGAFVMGSGSQPGYEGSRLAGPGGVVGVTGNYPLGALGFLHLAEHDPDHPDAGNLGILDQIAALRWVRDNIEAFGGDPDNVTIFGESAGGMSVGTLLGTPEAQGLFHKAIPQSGAAHNVSDTSHAAGITEAFLAKTGIDSVEDLKRLRVEQLLEVQADFVLSFFTGIDRHTDDRNGVRIPFQPVADGVVLHRRAIDHVAAGSAAGVPILVGTCRDEWPLFPCRAPAELDDAGLEARLAKVFHDPADAAAVYRSSLPGSTPKDLFGAAVTDLTFRIPAIRLAEAAHANGSDVYAYQFTWESPAMGGGFGACHALDVPFVFGTTEAAGLGILLGDAPPVSLVDAMQESWLAFARTGDPSNDRLGRWPTYEPERRQTMRLDEATEVLEDPESERRDLWEGMLVPSSEQMAG